MITNILNSTRPVVNRIKLFFARRDLELAVFAEAKLRSESLDKVLGSLERTELVEASNEYRLFVIPRREVYLRECEVAVLADSIGKM